MSILSQLFAENKQKTFAITTKKGYNDLCLVVPAHKCFEAFANEIQPQAIKDKKQLAITLSARGNQCIVGIPNTPEMHKALEDYVAHFTVVEIADTDETATLKGTIADLEVKLIEAEKQSNSQPKAKQLKEAEQSIADLEAKLKEAENAIAQLTAENAKLLAEKAEKQGA